MLKLYITYGMVFDKVQEIISFRKTRWAEKYIGFNTQKKIKAKNDFENFFYKLLKNAFYGKQWKIFVTEKNRNYYRS